MTRLGVHSVRRQRGLAVVELTFLAVLLLALVFGATEFGRAIYYYDTMVKSARAAARYLSYYDPWQQQAGTPSVPVVTYARNLALCGLPVADCGSNPPIVPGLTASNVLVELPSPPAGYSTPPNAVVDSALGNIDTGSGNTIAFRVTISPAGNRYRFQFLAPFVTDLARIDFGPISATFARPL